MLTCAASAHASVYYVTVAGLGGEPDYEQRFTANAKDLDKLFKASGNGGTCLYPDRAPGDQGQLTANPRLRSRTTPSRKMTLC